jgi:dihydrofolate reductase
MISLIWAMARNGVIGIDNRLPWKLPADMRWFREHTLGKPVVMGRKTFESFGSKPLPQRRNIVISRAAAVQDAGIEVVDSLAAALQRAQDAPETMIIGGASIYAQALPLADRLYITEVDAEPAGDAHFPAFAWEEWRELTRRAHAADDKNPYACTFRILERR